MESMLSNNRKKTTQKNDDKLTPFSFVNEFSKWIKSTELDDLEAVKTCYGYSNEKARQVLTLLSNEQLTELKQRVYKGGYTNNKSARNSSS